MFQASDSLDLIRSLFAETGMRIRRVGPLELGLVGELARAERGQALHLLAAALLTDSYAAVEVCDETVRVRAYSCEFAIYGVDLLTILKTRVDDLIEKLSRKPDETASPSV